jgi:3D (Asp-Asp-Asp) domain-containing protein
MISRRTSRIRMAGFLALGLGLLGGCRTDRNWLGTIPAARRGQPDIVRMEVTAYCPCGECCNWRRNWLGRPVIASGPSEGKRKAVGITASGTEANPGTIAADPKLYPFGTVLYVPGYGYGRVEDTGRDIVGRRIDVYFPRHGRAEDWGRQALEVRVWRP